MMRNRMRKIRPQPGRNTLRSMDSEGLHPVMTGVMTPYEKPNRRFRFQVVRYGIRAWKRRVCPGAYEPFSHMKSLHPVMSDVLHCVSRRVSVAIPLMNAYDGCHITIQVPI